MTPGMVEEIIEACGDCARRYAEAGYDGVELMTSHGLLWAQFLNPATNRREDQHGGSFEYRPRPLADALAACAARLATASQWGCALGRGSMDLLAVCKALCEAGLVDYVNTPVGSMAGPGARFTSCRRWRSRPATSLRERAPSGRCDGPVFVAGRINQPQIAERILR